MRTLTAALNAELLRPDGASFRWLVVVTPKGGVARHLCADPQIIGAITYTGQLLGISPMYESSTGVGDLTLEIADNQANRAAVVLAAEVTVSLWPVGKPATDATILFYGEISDPTTRHGGKITADAVSFASLGSRMMGTPLSLSDYPGADPDAVGRIMPVIYGIVQGAPCLAIDAGSMTNLQDPMTAVAAIANVSDTAALPSAGIIQLDIEQISYTGKTATSLIGLTRGINGTTASPHDKGSAVAEVQTQYDYLVADHPVKAITAVYVDGVRQLGSDFTIVLNDPINHRAMLRFNTLPTIIRQVNLVVDASSMSYTTSVGLVDGIEVIDQTGVTTDLTVADPGHSHASTTSGNVTASFTSAGATSGTVSWLASLNDGNWNSYCQSLYYSFQLLLSHTLSASPGSPLSMNVTVKAQPLNMIDVFGNITANTGSLSIGPWGSGGVFYGLDFSAGNNYTVTRTVNIGAYASITDLVASATGGWRIYEIKINSIAWGSSAGVSVGMAGVTLHGGVTRTGGKVTKGGTGITTNPVTTASGNPVLTGNSVADTKIGGLVTVDVQGWADDGAGSITGVAGALIERPDHVVRHILINYGSVLPIRAASVDFANYGADRLAIHLSGNTTPRSLIADLARQTGSTIAFSGDRWLMRSRQTVVPAINITDADIIRLENGASTIIEASTGLRGLKNRHRWRCGKKASGNGWEAADVVESASSQGLYGVREEIVDLPYVPNAAQASALVVWLALRGSNPYRKIITLQLTLKHYALEVGDKVSIYSSKAGVNMNGEIINIGPRNLSGKNNGSMTITVEEF